MKQPLKIAHKKPSISQKFEYLDRKKNNVDRSIASKTQDYSEFAFGNISIRLGEIFCKPSSEAIARRLLLTIYYLLTSKYTPDRAFCPSAPFLNRYKVWPRLVCQQCATFVVELYLVVNAK